MLKLLEKLERSLRHFGDEQGLVFRELSRSAFAESLLLGLEGASLEEAKKHPKSSKGWRWRAFALSQLAVLVGVVAAHLRSFAVETPPAPAVSVAPRPAASPPAGRAIPAPLTLAAALTAGALTLRQNRLWSRPSSLEPVEPSSPAPHPLQTLGKALEQHTAKRASSPTSSVVSVESSAASEATTPRGAALEPRTASSERLFPAPVAASLPRAPSVPARRPSRPSQEESHHRGRSKGLSLRGRMPLSAREPWGGSPGFDSPEERAVRLATKRPFPEHAKLSLRKGTSKSSASETRQIFTGHMNPVSPSPLTFHIGDGPEHLGTAPGKLSLSAFEPYANPWTLPSGMQHRGFNEGALFRDRHS